MIPKIIHFCWFGRNPLPEQAQKCIASWKQYCPDYQIIEWNEDNFDIDSAPLYVRQAHAAKKWAFITDYVRLYALTKLGGIYMETDVEVIKPLDPFLQHRAFSGFEDETQVPTGIMACEKGFPLFLDLMHHYDTAIFPSSESQMQAETNVVIITNTLSKKGLCRNNTYQEIEGFALYPKDYFCPKSYVDGKIYLTDNTATIHHFSASWKGKKEAKIITDRWAYFEKLRASKFLRLRYKSLSDEAYEEKIHQIWGRKQRRIERIHLLLHSPFKLLQKVIGADRFQAIKRKIRGR